MVRMDSFSSVPPHIQPPIAPVPSAILELTRFVPSMLMYSSIVCRYLPAYLELVVFLAKPLRVGVGAVEPMTCFIELELPRFRSLCRFFEKHRDRKSTRLNSSHQIISYAVFCLKKKKKHSNTHDSRTITNS